MIPLIGYTGFLFLIISYIILNTKYSKYFLYIDVIATIFLIIYSILLKDIIFILVNAFILVMLVVKQIKGGIK